MITYHKEYGCWFQMTEDSKHYTLYEAKTYKHNTTSDRVIIWDEDNDEMVNFVYGANTISIEELDNVVSDYVAEYEAKQKAEAKNKVKAFIKYEFTKSGIEAFKNRASADFFAEMDSGGEHIDDFDILVSCGKHQIRVPLGAEEWNSVEVMLTDCWEVNE